MSESLSALDNLFLRLETPTTPMHVGGVLVFRGDGRDPAAQLEALLRTPVCARPFDRRVCFPARGLSIPHWQQVESVDLRAHVHSAALESPASDGDLMHAISELHSQPVSRDRPMWECQLIHGLSDDRYALYFKVHHACIDGVSGIQRIQQALSSGPGDETVPVWAIPLEEKPRRTRRSPSLIDRARALRNKARALPELARHMWSVNRGAARGDGERSAAPYTAPNTPLNGLIGGARSVAWRSLPLASVRDVGRATGATVNEVVLAICSTVLRELLLESDDLPAAPLVAMVPFSLRDAGRDGQGGNDVSCILCNLATHLPDPVQRLATIAASSRDGKAMLRSMSREAAATYWLAVGFPAILAAMAGAAKHFPLPFNVVVSNVPGPRASLYQNGAELEAIYPASLLFERQALNITLVSYLDRLDIGLLACSETVPDLQRLALRFGAAFAELEREVLNRQTVL